jgi:hypothetical protein
VRKIFNICERPTNPHLSSQYNTTKSYETDPQFPSRLRNSGLPSTWRFIQHLVEDYSERGLTKPSDRTVAISGLMARIGKALDCRVTYGIIECYMHRTLLWRRSSGQTTGMINYSPEHRVPSWSWMAYEGAIKFPPVQYNDLNMTQTLRISDRSLSAEICRVVDPDMRFVAVTSATLLYDLQNSNGEKRGWLRLDHECEETVSSARLHAAVLARQDSYTTDGLNRLVMFIRPRASQEGYERVGMGRLHRLCELDELGKHEIF